MKTKGIIIVVIALLSAWSIFATYGAISAEEDNRKQMVRHALLESSYETKKEAYDKMKAERDELEEDCEEYKDMYYSEHSTRIAYEWLFDVCANQGNENYDSDVSLQRILRREYSWLNMEIVDEQTFAAVMSVHKKQAKIILLEYDIDIKIK